LHRHDPGFADRIAHDAADAAIQGGPDLIIGLERKADAGQPGKGNQGRQGHGGRGQQFDAAGAKLRQHFRITAKLAVGKNRHRHPPLCPFADLSCGLGEAHGQRVCIGRVDPKLELKLGGGCGAAKDRGSASKRGCSKQAPSRYFP